MIHLDGRLLAHASIRHHVSPGGVATTQLCVDGERLVLDDAVGLNRLTIAPRRAMAARDAEFAAGERWSLWASVCAALPSSMVGRGGVHGLCGPAMTPELWRAAARRAELPVGNAPADRVLVVAGRVVGPRRLAGRADAYRSLASVAGADVLGVDVDGDGAIVSASCSPDLRAFGEWGLAALEAAW